MTALLPAPTGLSRPILVIEDNDEDYETLRRILQHLAFAAPISRCVDGEAALDYLHQQGPSAGGGRAPSPALILLDLNLPGTDGREVLAQVKQDQRLKVIPIVVLTTSSNPKDIDFCYRAGANSYLIKVVQLEQFTRSIGHLVHYWFEAVTLPGEEDRS